MTDSSERSAEIKLSEVLSAFARTMATDFHIQAILDHLVGRIVDLLPIGAAGVTLISETLSPRYVAASNDDALMYEKLQTEMGEGPCLLAYHSNKTVAIADLRDDDHFPRFSPSALRVGLRAVFTFPLRHGDVRMGALDLYRDTPGGLNDTQLAAAQTLADVAAAYLVNAQTRADLQDSSDRSLTLALHDGLTGLPNRTLMLERLHRAFQRSGRSGSVSAVLFVDLDDFKSINDTYGHSVGDEVLMAVATRLAGALRPSDTVARLHGDEFVILCEDLGAPDEASVIVGRLQSALLHAYPTSAGLISTSASVGIAFADHDAHDPEQALRDADAAMYQAKRAGGSNMQVFDPRYRHLTHGVNNLELDLVGAQARGELHTQYQPIVVTDDSRIVGFEALLRWTHPTRGPVAPAAFIPVAEQSSLIKQLGRHVLGEACEALNRLQAHRRSGTPELTMAVNTSPRELTAAGFVDRVANVLDANRTRPELLILEITESAFVNEQERTFHVLRDLKELGIQIALDDFGTGYSSLSYLNQFPVDIVKVDRSFTTNLEPGSVSHIITRAVVQLAHSLKMMVIAEGVETARQHHQVRRLDCDLSQGFFFARSQPIAGAAALLASGLQRPTGAELSEHADRDHRTSA